MTAIPLRRIEGKYEILEKIREGGMGAIYKVRHRLLDEIRVIKLMRPQLVEDEELRARFLREARLAIKLRHPNIAQLYDFTVDDDGTAFIVMEFIDGVTLEDLLALHGPPPLDLALEVARQALKALGYLHLKGFVHRDISPDNLMLTADTDGQPLLKLIDLGIAKTLGVGGESHLTQAGTFLGKIRYASPEQFGADGATTIDGRGDLYSFGVVLYELLTRCFPIQGRDPSSLIAGHLFRPPLDFAETDPDGRVPEGVRAVVLRALEKSPGERFAAAADFARALAPFRAPGAVSEEMLRTFLSRPFVPAEGSLPTDSGSTQGRLDRSFDLATTPSRGSQLRLVDAPLRREDDERGALAAALAGIVEALEQKSYGQAESLLYAAEARFGSRPELAPLHERLAEERRRDLEARADRRRRNEEERAAKVAAALAAARDRLAREEPKEALKALREAVRLDPANAEAGALAAEAEEAVKRLAEAKRRQQRRAQALAEAVAEIRGAVDREETETAGRLLDLAVVRFGAADPLREQWERLEQARRAGKERERERQQESEAVFAATREIADLLSRREPRQALKALKAAVSRFGERGELAELRQRVAAMLLDG